MVILYRQFEIMGAMVDQVGGVECRPGHKMSAKSCMNILFGVLLKSCNSRTSNTVECECFLFAVFFWNWREIVVTQCFLFVLYGFLKDSKRS